MIFAIIMGIIFGIAITIYFAKTKHCTCHRVIDSYIAPVISVIVFTALYKAFGFGKLYIIYSMLMGISTAIVIIDIKTQTIPKILLIICFIVSITALLISQHIELWDGLIGFIISGSTLLLLSLMTKGGLGMGDVFYFAIMGLAIGIEKTIASLTLTALLSGIFGIIAISINKQNIKKTIAFTPIIMLGIFLSLIS